MNPFAPLIFFLGTKALKSAKTYVLKSLKVKSFQVNLYLPIKLQFSWFIP